MFIEDKVLDISRNYYHYLMSLENVVGVGLGHKDINEISTLEPCIHVLVEKKVNERSLSSKNNIIPKSYMGIKTDVIETGSFSFRESENAVPYKFRPLRGGSGITVENHYVGTLGCIVTKRLRNDTFFYILTNSHVVADVNEDVPRGTPIIQPSHIDNGSFSRHIVARLSTFIPLKFKEEHRNHDNLVDAAIGKIYDRRLVSSKIFDVGKITGVSSAIIGEKVKKVGMASGKSYGRVTSIGTTMSIKRKKGKKGTIFYKDQIEAKIYNIPGDSGSILLNGKNEAIGLLHSGSGANDGTEYATCSDIKIVLRSLNVSMYVE